MTLRVPTSVSALQEFSFMRWVCVVLSTLSIRRLFQAPASAFPSNVYEQFFTQVLWVSVYTVVIKAMFNLVTSLKNFPAE